MHKRVFDVLCAAVALLLLMLPFVLIALWIRLDSPGPVFYRQIRVGRHGRPFRIHKFRTMRRDADRTGLALTVAQDARITRAGRFLRAHRIDELPQFLDVLRGDMSLVGPRPEVPQYVEHYPQALRAVVLSVRPGMTDPASLAHRDADAWLKQVPDPERHYIETLLPHKLRLQAEYVQSATFGSDLRVLRDTACVLFGRASA